MTNAGITDSVHQENDKKLLREMLYKWCSALFEEKCVEFTAGRSEDSATYRSGIDRRRL